MVKAIREMKQRMNDVDVVIETRDARLPLTSINPVFEEILKGPSNKNNKNPVPSPSFNSPVRLVVYNKKDLADHRLEKVCMLHNILLGEPKVSRLKLIVSLIYA